VTFFSTSATIAFAISTFIGTIVSFASVQTLQNFIAGLYIISTRPFAVYDLVKIGGFEGVVVQISLNYTKIRNFDRQFHLIPNSIILKNNITNYNRKIPKEKAEEKNLRGLQKLKDMFDDDRKEVVRYSFIVPFPLGNVKQTKEDISNVCKTYEEIFGYKPSFFLIKVGYTMDFNFIVTSDNVEKIIQYASTFIGDLSKIYH
jgi:hypothetical protein